MSSNLIGKEVTADFSGVYCDGDSEPEISYTLKEDADKVVFEIRDDNDTLVRTLTINVGTKGPSFFPEQDFIPVRLSLWSCMLQEKDTE